MTLSELELLVRARVGTNISTDWTLSKIASAFNTVRATLINKYDLDFFYKTDSIAFTSGDGTKPSDFDERFQNQILKTDFMIPVMFGGKKLTISGFYKGMRKAFGVK